ncbi:MAG: DUF3987 domain-containing protein [Proteobacteria bacterium]|nr:DUF3987 domain-containing protein [Pseudomonadota bacterium]
MLTDAVIDRYQLGFEQRNSERRVLIPVRDADGIVVDIRRWLPPENRQDDERKKMRPWKVGYGAARLFPIDQLEADELVFSEGELDALALISHGISAITLTAGAPTAPDRQAGQCFKGKRVTLLMDHDAAGQKGAISRAEALAPFCEVQIASWPEDRDKGWDVTDELKQHGVESIKAILADSEPFVGFVGRVGGGISEIEWPEPQPLPAALPDVEPFRIDLLPVKLQPWIEDIAERMQCPMDFPAVGAMVALAATVGRQVGIRPQQYDDWLVVPNLWGAVVGRPGVLKSPALQEPLRPLEQLEKKAKADFDADQQSYEIDKVVAEARRKKGQDDIKRALKQGLDPHDIAIDSLAGGEGPPQRRRYICNDTTVEMLGEVLKVNTRGVLVFRDELTGLLKSLDKDGRESDKAFYLESWNGTGRFTYDRIGRGTVDIEAACVSILGGIQPGPFSAYMGRVVQGGGDDDGLVQRFQLAVWPDVPKAWSNQDRAPDMAVRATAWAVYERLDQLNPDEIGATSSDYDTQPPYLRFSSDAQALFVEWREELEAQVRSGDEHPMLEAHLAKYRSLIPTLALLSHLADGHTGPVEIDHLRRACAWGEYLESHARRLFAPAIAPQGVSARALATRLKKGDVPATFTLRDVYLKGWTGLNSNELALQAVQVLEEMDWLREAKVPTPGRPKTVYVLNPAVLTGEMSDG